MSVDDPVPLESDVPFQLESRAQLLQAIKAVHDPIVLLDQHGLHLNLLGDDAQQGREILLVMQEINRHAYLLRVR
ncbi:hypothetical protein [Rhizobium favelukesii]|uniref:Uncharacterized protein n=1 Tax=Rhizobium favelukesii TaxID=348824 RepID=W6S6Q3_9HYPH|nr:hypothetical protein [Rhizobium favelukesii]CDM61896.1 hypothetical protein LPU83_pLPU83d_0525 [Rhizobium favelukesii]